MHLILSGGGNPDECKKVDEYYRKLVKGKRHLLYIPIAWHMDFNPAKMWAGETLRRASRSYETWINVKYRSPEDLRLVDAIYIGGGNTFALLDTFRNAQFIPLLKKFLQAGKPVYGSSAGAIIFGRDIGTASFGGDPDQNLPKIKNLRGLDLLHGYSVGCHYRPIDDRYYKRYSKKFPVIALPNETGLHVENNKITVIGSLSAFLFVDGEKTVLPVGSVATYS